MGRKQSEPWWGACALPVVPTETTTDGNVYELKDWSGTVLETFRELQYRSTYIYIPNIGFVTASLLWIWEHSGVVSTHRLAGIQRVVQLMLGVIRLRSSMRFNLLPNIRHSYNTRHTVTPRCSDISVDSQSPCD